MRKIKILLLLVVSLASFGIAQPAGSPVAKYGQLKVSGNKIKDKNNNDVQLRGMSFFWGNSKFYGYMFWNKDVLNWLINDWAVDVIRIPLPAYDKDVNTGFYWQNSSAAHRRNAEVLIDAAIEQGVYVVLDWHAHHQGRGAKDSAKAVFRDFSKKYGSKPNMIYELYNEPINDSWSQIRSYANEIVPVIRANDANNIILVGTPFYSQNLNQVVGNTVNGTNIGYVLHFYAMEHGGNLQGNAQALLNANQMVFVTEWGTTMADGGENGQWSASQSDVWLNWMDQRKISWCNWSVTYKDEASAILKHTTSEDKVHFGGWDESDLTPSGKFIRCKLRQAAGKNCNFDTPKSSSSAEEVSSSSAEPGTGELQIIPGKLEPEQYAMALGARVGGAGRDDSDPLPEADRKALSFITNGTWAEYNVFISETASYDIAMSIAGIRDANVKASIDGSAIGTFTIKNNGKSAIFDQIQNVAKLNLPKGHHTLRFDFSRDDVLSMPSISWMEFTSPGVVPKEPTFVRQIAVKANHSWMFSHGNLAINNNYKHNLDVIVSNIMGAQLAKFQLSPGNHKLDLSAWSGLHIVSLKHGAKTIATSKIVLAK